MTYSFSKFNIWIVLISALSALVFTGCNKNVSKPNVVDGEIDLRNWDFEKDGSVRLNGDWAFYWSEFLTEFTNEEPKSYFEVPKLWNNSQVADDIISGIGYSTYRITAFLPVGQELALQYRNSATACEIFIDGESVFRSGKPEKSKGATIPSYKPGIVQFIPDNEAVDIVLHVANFHHHKGGVWEPITVGSAPKTVLNQKRRLYLDLLLMGAVLIMALFHIIIYLTHKTELSSLFFGLFALFVAIRFAVSGEFSIYQLGTFNWDNLVRIDYFSFYVSILFFAKFIAKQFREEFNRVVDKTIVWVSLILALSVILPPIYFTRAMLYFQIVLLVAFVYTIRAIIVALIRNKKGPTYFLLAFLVLFVFTLNDILNENDVLHTFALGTAGTAIFILFQASFLASQVREALVANQVLSKELSFQNKEFQELNKEYLEQNQRLTIAKEKAEESDRFKTAFLANISHEIRTPMNGILGFAELINDPDLEPEKREQYFNILYERGNHLLGIVNDIIDISKIETGQVNIRNEKVDVNALILQAASIFREQAKMKNVAFDVHLPNNVVELMVDKLKFRQIIDNLLSNSVKFTKKGKVEIGFDVDTTNVNFYVKDTGVGMTPDEATIVFDRFNQANHTIAQKYGGSGLGLTIVKAFIEKMGGEIWVESVKGEGTSFFFTLPYLVL